MNRHDDIEAFFNTTVEKRTRLIGLMSRSGATVEVHGPSRIGGPIYVLTEEDRKIIAAALQVVLTGMKAVSDGGSFQ